MEKDNSNKLVYKYFWLIVAISLALIVGLWYWNYSALVVEVENRGTFGDMFGAVNAIFSGLAFAGIIISLYLQRIDLKNQQEQLILNREEIRVTNEEFRIQNETLQIQKFENTFFNMLSIHHKIVDSIDFSMNLFHNKLKLYLSHKLATFAAGSSERYVDIKEAFKEKGLITSRDVFKNSIVLLYNLIKDDIKGDTLFYEFKKSSIESNNNVITSRFSSIYKLIYSTMDTDLGHYYRNLYRMFKLIDEKQFTYNKVDNYKIQYSYTSIIRAQLSDAEVQWLFFNCLHKNGFEKFKPLVEKYTLLKVINLDNEVYKYYSRLYSKTAFNKPDDIREHIHGIIDKGALLL